MKRRNLILLAITAISSIASALTARTESTPKKLMLLETSIAGFQFYAGERVFTLFQQDQPLTLNREADNAYDQNAVALYWQDEKLGYLPRTDNVVIAQMMDRDEALSARIAGLRLFGSPWERVGVVVGCWV